MLTILFSSRILLRDVSQYLHNRDKIGTEPKGFRLWRPAAQAKRAALVIGISDYQHLSSLINPVLDAKAIAAELKVYKFKDSDGTVTDTFEEGSHLKEYVYKITGGTGKYQGATGGGTYSFDNLTDTLGVGRYKGQIVLP
jgi:hypothetical protein